MILSLLSCVVAVAAAIYAYITHRRTTKLYGKITTFAENTVETLGLHCAEMSHIHQVLSLVLCSAHSHFDLLKSAAVENDNYEAAEMYANMVKQAEELITKETGVINVENNKKQS
jgi:hypothetical protein